MSRDALEILMWLTAGAWVVGYCVVEHIRHRLAHWWHQGEPEWGERRD